MSCRQTDTWRKNIWLLQLVDFLSEQHVRPFSCKDNKDIDDSTLFIVYTHQISLWFIPEQAHHRFLETLIINANKWLCPYRYSFWEVVNDLQILNWSARSFAPAVFWESLQGSSPFYFCSHLLGISGICWYINTLVCIWWYSIV